MQQIEEMVQMRTQMLEQAKRNEAIADLMNFKRYIPGHDVELTHKQTYAAPMQWYYIPNVGRYNSFELKFHSDWNWLISAAIEFRKYKSVHEQTKTTPTKLDIIFHRIKNINPFDLDKRTLWILLSDYALVLKEEKQREKHKDPA